MTVKQFEAPNMPDALRQVRADLGERAVILETRRIRRGLLGLLGLREQVQVKAALDADGAPAREASVVVPLAVQSYAAVACPQRMAPPRPEPARPWSPPPLRLPVAAPPAQPADLAARLAESGLDEALSEQVMAACGREPSEAALARAIARLIPVPRPTQNAGCARVALVGPTGVGKTTTAAKLAARYALTERKRVALITIDTYRIGAVEQLRTYARVMGLPLEVVQSPDEMPGAIARHADKDVVLIDTVGRSPRRSLQLAEIQAFLNGAEPTETHLVLAAPSGPAYLEQTAERFACLGTDRLIVTKLDEMPRWGVIAGLAHRTGLPVAYITDGQDVPRDLRPANADEIALRILGGADA